MKKITTLVLAFVFTVFLAAFSPKINASGNFDVYDFEWTLEEDGYEYLTYNHDALVMGSFYKIDMSDDNYNVEALVLKSKNGEVEMPPKMVYADFFKYGFLEISFEPEIVGSSYIPVVVLRAKKPGIVGEKNVELARGIKADVYGVQYDVMFEIKRKVIEPDIIDDISHLPKTFKTYDGVDVGTVNFIVDGNNVTVEILLYGRVTYIDYSFSSGTDMTIFTESTEAYYLNQEDNPSILINHSEFKYLLDIILAPEDEKPAFVPHTIWDLENNQLKTISQYTTYAYIKQTEKGPIIAYVYIDDFIIDKMLTIQVSWTQRQKNGWPLSWFGKKYGDWTFQNETYTDEDYLKYRKISSNWEDLIPLWNIFKVIQMVNRYYTMPRIDAVNFKNLQPEYNITKAEVEMYFKELDPNFTNLNTNPRFKLWAIALQGGKKSTIGWAQTQIYDNKENLKDPKNFHIFHITYETNGKLYETIGDHMNLKIYVEDKLLPKKDNRLFSLIIILMLGVIGLAAFKFKAFASPQNAIKFIFSSLLIIGFIVVVYFVATGLIT